MRRTNRTRLGLLVIVPLLLAQLPSTAGTAGAAPPQPSAEQPSPPAGEVSSHRVTLITGDTVTYAVLADGRGSFSVQPAERPGGARVHFEGFTGSDGYYVIPSDAARGLAAGTLDQQLFNVSGLVRDGLADATSVPVIVTYPGHQPAAALPATLPATTKTAALTSINGVALRVDTARAADFWQATTQQTTTQAPTSATTGKIWLDRTVRTALDQTVPQIGAPAAWEAGYDGAGVRVAVLDTGIDAGHPDLAGRVVQTANFTAEPDVVDGNGHGTHVASILAGAGERYRGVAPAADLMIGKVLPSSGQGPLSAVIAGMEWAARNGARVINLSLGGPPTDGTDPASLAVDALSAETGALFVIATGNDSADANVATPAAASSALSVGAVDKQDELAPYSNRGPRLGDAAVKPELTAPGSGVVAARAAGTALGTPVDDRYTMVSGTSMATPHVAGAAALLAQAHPDWAWAQLKDALISTATPGEYTVFQGGTGRVDLVRAFGQRVSGPGALSFGRFAAPWLEERTRVLIYRNGGDEPVTLTLAVTGHGWDGRPLPDGALRLPAGTLTVPPGGAAGVPLTVAATPGDPGGYVALVTATDEASTVSLRTAVSYYKGADAHELTVRTLDSAGAPDDGGMPSYAVKIDDGLANDPFLQPVTWTFTDPDGVARLRVAPGSYDVYSAVTESDVVGRRTTVMAEPEVAITGDTTVVLDARRGVPVQPRLPEPAEVLTLAVGTLRGFAGGREFGHEYLFDFESWGYYVTPTRQVSTGWLEASERWRFGTRLVDAQVSAGSGGRGDAGRPDGRDWRDRSRRLSVGYRPFYAGPALAGVRTLPLVFAGGGTPAELAAAGVAGKLALVRIRIPDGEPFRMGYAWNAAQQITADAVAAAAAGVLVYVDVPGAWLIDGLRSEPILQLSVSAADGERLRAQLGHRPARLTLSGRANPERIYQLRYRHDGAVPGRYDQPVDPRQLVRIDASYHTDRPNQADLAAWASFSPRERFQSNIASPFWAPAEWTEYVGPATDPDLQWLRATFQTTGGRELGQPQTSLQSRDVFRPGQHPVSERWFEAPLHHGAADVPGGYPAELRCSYCRHGDFFLTGFHYLDSEPRHYQQSFTATSQYRLLRNGQELRKEGSTSQPRWRLPAETGQYRLEAVDTQPIGPDVRALAPRVISAWTFTSTQPPADARPTGYTCPVANLDAGCAFQPLLQLKYQLGLDPHNSTRAGRHFWFDVTVGPHRAAPYSARAAGLRIWASTDDGASWQPAYVQPHRDGRFRVLLSHPRLEHTNGYVWLRAEAWDTAANRVEQTIERAYALH